MDRAQRADQRADGARGRQVRRGPAGRARERRALLGPGRGAWPGLHALVGRRDLRDGRPGGGSPF
ncbi:MAG: hypothetical protein ACK559_34615, partial [bacterium]